MEEEYRFPQTVLWVQEGMLSVSVARKWVHYSGRPGNTTEDTIEMLQVWSCGGKGVKGSQDWWYLVQKRKGRGRIMVRWHWEQGTPVER